MLDESRRYLVGKHDNHCRTQDEPEQCLDIQLAVGLARLEECEEYDDIDSNPDEFATEGVPKTVCPRTSIVVE